ARSTSCDTPARPVGRGDSIRGTCSTAGLIATCTTPVGWTRLCHLRNCASAHGSRTSPEPRRMPRISRGASERPCRRDRLQEEAGGDHRRLMDAAGGGADEVIENRSVGLEQPTVALTRPILARQQGPGSPVIAARNRALADG